MVVFLSASSITKVIEEDARRLFSQLSHRRQLSVSELFEGDAPWIAGYVENGRLLGMASMAVYKVISGYKGWIEDVVVDENQRGKKIGKQLISRLIEKGNELGLGEILLFTSSKRETAIRLYEQMGFQRKGSEVFVNALQNMYPE